MVPVRCPPEFGTAANPTVAFPLPEAAVVMESQSGALVAAFHPQWPAVVTAMLPVPPVAATLCEPGDTWTSQAAAS
jgi:hypothetical protein